MTTNLKQEERLDDLQIHGYEIIQHPGRFCFGMDAVLLSNFAAVKTERMCAGSWNRNGNHSNPSGSKDRREHFTGLEIQKESADMAQRSVAHNHLEQKITIQTGDIKEAGTIFSPASFDVITTNPPYMLGEHGLKNEADAKTIARHEVLCTLDDILRESAKLLKFKGRFYMVHRPFRLPEILTKMSMHGIEPKRMRLVHPYIDKEPNMVLIEGSRGGRPRMKVEPPLIVYREPGVYTEELLQGYSMK